VTLTEAGSEYLARIGPILKALDEADHAARGDGILRGTLRIGVTSIMASRILVPMLPDFAGPHPDLRIELVIDDRRQDLISDHVDLAIRFGQLADSSAIARFIGKWPMIIAAAPAYIERSGAPKTPEELADHRFIVAGPAARKGLTLRQGSKEISVAISGKIAITGAEVAINAGVAGLGIVATSYPSVAREIERGELVRLLPDWDMGELEAHALFPSGQSPKPSARAFVEFLIQHIRT
jgi:DNA-binding transcriptional LysR family regulator